MKPRKVRVRLAIAALGLSLALGIATDAPAASQASTAPKGPPLIYQKSRSFRVPFHFDPAERARRRELQLWVSNDLGRNWKQKGVTTPDRPAFTFNAEHDGEYWLAVRSVDSQGRLFPGDQARIEPSMKVIVDTTPPSIVLEPQSRSASLASVRWEIRDENPDESHPPILQYQVEGSNEWLPVPIDEKGLLGVATWDAGYTEPLKVRATAIDRAGNKAETLINLASSKPGQAPVVASEPKPSPAPDQPPQAGPSTASALATAPPGEVPAGPPSVAPESAESREQVAAGSVPGPPDGQGGGQAPIASVYPSAQDVAHHDAAPTPLPVAIEQSAPDASPVGAGAVGAPFATRMATGPLRSASPGSEVAMEGARDGRGSKVVGAPRPDLRVPRVGALDKTAPQSETPDRQTLPDVAVDPGVGMAALTKPVEPASSPVALPPGQITKLKVPGQRFLLDYAVDRAGPDGRPAAVELWITVDGGKTWSRGGNDPDRVSPILVDLNGVGTFGISLIARDANGLGDKPPAPGDTPKMWIEVESPPLRASRSPNMLQRALRR